MNRAWAYRRCRGFTLVEVTVALGILAVIMLGLAATATTSYVNTQASKKRLQATYLANDMLENLSSSIIVSDVTIYHGVNTKQTFPPGASLCAPWKQAIENQLGSGARGEILVEDITEAANQPLSGKKRITITVFWPYRTSGENKASVVGVR